MSPAVTLPDSSFVVTLLEKGPKEKYNFGAFITGLDLNNISDADVERLKEAVWTHKIVIIKGQKDLEPIKQWELVTRCDPDAPQVHSHGDVKTFTKQGGMLAKVNPIIGIPGAENVRLIGKGYQGPDHYGLKDLTLNATGHAYHAVDLPDPIFQSGHTRFQRWHIDAPLYARDPAWFTTLRAVKLPVGPDLTIHWDDGSRTTMKAKPGLTAFISTCQLYEMLDEEEKQLVDHSWVEYAPHPYKWIEHCKGNTTGLGLKSQGKEHTMEEMGDFDPAQIKRYPLVWVNPITGEKAFQVHSICAYKLFLRSSPTETPKVVTSIDEIRAFVTGIQSRILKPEYILIAPMENGDVAMWDNYGMFHTAVEYPQVYGSRTMHQANIGSSVGPIGPVEIPTSV